MTNHQKSTECNHAKELLDMLNFRLDVYHSNLKLSA